MNPAFQGVLRICNDKAILVIGLQDKQCTLACNPPRKEFQVKLPAVRQTCNRFAVFQRRWDIDSLIHDHSSVSETDLIDAGRN
jgi:hypothetical protein